MNETIRLQFLKMEIFLQSTYSAEAVNNRLIDKAT